MISNHSYLQGMKGEHMAQRLLSKSHCVEKAPNFYGDLKVVSFETGLTSYIEVKTVSTNRVTIRKDGSQHLVYADYVLVFRLDKDEMYLIPRKEIGENQKRLYLSSTSKYGKYLIRSISTLL